MKSKKDKPTDSEKNANFKIEGDIQREQAECESGDLKLAVYVFDRAGALIGNTDIKDKGNYSVSVRLNKPAQVQLIIGPIGDAQQIRHSSAYSKLFAATDWRGEEQRYSLHFDSLLPLAVWRLWWPQRICVSGHVRKLVHQDSNTELCPVPFVKVEIYDVDREACWWPWLRKWPDLALDRQVVRIPDLLKEPPFPPRPFPRPDLLPELDLGGISDLSQGINLLSSPLPKVTINPQPEPPGKLQLASATTFKRVGEAALLDNTTAARLDNLTLTSKLAPWHVFPLCFYSKALLCETNTDCNGYFNCCFNWSPFHFRRGRLRFDARPDIIIKVTQIVNGVKTVIYMDPYTSTRWNVNNTHIDLFLDNEEVICGNGHCYEPPTGSPVFFTRIGDDEVYQINQTTGLYNQTPYSNVAYGHSLLVYGQFGDHLTSSDPVLGDPPPYYYYRLSYAKQGSHDHDFKFIDVTLNDTRVDKSTLIGLSHKLGPYQVNAVPSLYEMRNFNDYYWYNPDWIGVWQSWLAEEDTGIYILRMEVFDKNGLKLNTASGSVDYRNGAGVGNGIPPAPLPVMVDHSDLVITLDNKRPDAEITVPSVMNDCGVIPWAAVPPLDLYVNASQENNRLHGWHLWYTKGVGTEQSLASNISNNGLPGSFTNYHVSGASLLTGLDSTCAFALRLRAWAHVRNGRYFIFYDEDIDAIAIEKCP
ncbi:hypothetical protein CXF72_08595 [Psychromonas sp. MB-3u-54]|uniref:hypothetical protein n=1 Tax=Psychromonas sp. MB-3u-54 TaxID=2058319 RepID=UPI000C32236D|nr:hypothetical protein [Psychromonas sp. MB-3u-54]PKH02983.1 hypothetical protein CXF72_08595 [Psychromonas sp. MB-3u-54]